MQKRLAEKVRRMQQQGQSLEPDDAAASRASLTAGKKLGFSVKDSVQCVTVTIEFGKGDQEKLSLKDMDLEISDDNLRLCSKYGDALVDLKKYDLDCEEAVDAKMSQKKRTLKVQLSKRG